MDEDMDVVVVGGGLMGYCTAWQLCLRYGLRVVLVDKKQGHTEEHFSSRGASRMTRSLGSEDDVLSLIHCSSVNEVKAFVASKQSTLTLSDIYQTAPLHYIFPDEQTTPTTIFGIPEGDLPEHCSWTKSSPSSILTERRECTGTLNPEALLRGLRSAFKEMGGVVRVSTVIGVEVAEGVKVTVQEEGTVDVIASQHMVWCGGAFPPPEKVPSELLSIHAKTSPMRVPLFFFRFFGCSSQLHESLPAVHFTEQLAYIMKDAQEEEVIKIGFHHLREKIPEAGIDAVWAKGVTTEEIAMAEKAVKGHLALMGVAGEVGFVSGVSCVYSMTDSGVPLVANVTTKSGCSRVTYVGGMSGVGAKGCMAYGRIAAHLSRGGGTPLPEEGYPQWALDALSAER